jgi:methylase of polypeptide subunit release factors
MPASRPSGTGTPVPRRVHPVVDWLSRLALLPKREWLRRKVGRTVTERFAGLELVVPPEVFNPGIFRTGRYFTEFIATSPICDPSRFAEKGTGTALDATTGSGAQAIALARRGFQVTAVDINPHAVHAARDNAQRNGVSDRVTVLEGDLYGPAAGRRFDVIMSALPLFRGEARTPFEQSWRSPDVIERFAAGVREHLAPGGVCLALFTSDGDQQGFFSALDANLLAAEVASEKHFGNEIISIYAIGPGNVSPAPRFSIEVATDLS